MVDSGRQSVLSMIIYICLLYSNILIRSEETVKRCLADIPIQSLERNRGEEERSNIIKGPPGPELGSPHKTINGIKTKCFGTIILLNWKRRHLHFSDDVIKASFISISSVIVWTCL